MADIERFLVRWPARTMTSKRELLHVNINAVGERLLAIEYPYNLPVGSPLNIEFYVNLDGKKRRIRAKTKVVYCMLRAGGEGAQIDLKIIKASPEEIHTLNNVLMALTMSKEMNLRL